MPITNMSVSRSQGEDVDVIVTGVVHHEEDLIAVVFDPIDCPPCKTARLMASTFSVQSGGELLLYWEREEEHDLILPVDGKGFLDFSTFSGMLNPRNEGWSGKILLAASAVAGPARHFSIALHLVKQRN